MFIDKFDPTVFCYEWITYCSTRIYHFFHLDASNYLKHVPTNDIQLANQYTVVKPDFGCDPVFATLAFSLMARERLHMPETLPEARQTYDKLVDMIENL